MRKLLATVALLALLLVPVTVDAKPKCSGSNCPVNQQPAASGRIITAPGRSVTVSRSSTGRVGLFQGLLPRKASRSRSSCR